MEQVTTAAELKYDDRGLIPCVVQQYDTGEVLMVAWMNEESVGLTLKTGTTWFLEPQPPGALEQGRDERQYAGGQGAPGPSCDSDTLLVKVDSPGPACHTGNRTCFFRKLA